MEHMDGRALAEEVAGTLRNRAAALRERGIVPTLGILVVGDDERTASYIRAKERMASEIGIEVRVHRFEQSELPDRLHDRITKAMAHWNRDPAVHGLILQLPLPAGLDESVLLDCIDPTKDVDGLTSTNQHALEAGQPGIVPATPLGILALLQAYDVTVDGATVAIVGTGRLVGQPLAHLLQARGACVRLADRETADLAAVTRGAEIVVAAVGHPGLVTESMIDHESVLIDVGLTEQHGMLVGDTTEGARAKARLSTPVPGGVGPMTVVSLLGNVVQAAEQSARSQPSA
ncbi:bifunctional 5,10-methylenetetrahydrofolate dehydrogenase/5,10-methenyltetrahydrofolate cyclohydrolase [Candidatus Berkelbacteria bacterium]|nr:bifunctional 5,10-methylenetetrahydrofolate dehydrogenase/5,10-methenyltetrahydrofolate cyclohydrolase [Candidatus Berkelbacteria bacterium]